MRLTPLKRWLVGAPMPLAQARHERLSKRVALAVFSATQLPMVVAITTLAVQEGHMHSATAAALVGAAILSTTIFPILGLRLRAARS